MTRQNVLASGVEDAHSLKLANSEMQGQHHTHTRISSYQALWHSPELLMTLNVCWVDAIGTTST